MGFGGNHKRERQPQVRAGFDLRPLVASSEWHFLAGPWARCSRTCGGVTWRVNSVAPRARPFLGLQRVLGRIQVGARVSIVGL
jgi:hypothetical protein